METFFFESAIHGASEHCEIHTFDPTVDPNKPDVLEQTKKYNVTYHPDGIGEGGQIKNYKGEMVNLKSMSTIVKELGHTGRHISIFKIDCETCEYSTIPGLLKALDKGEFTVGQIQVEIHFPSKDNLAAFWGAIDNAKFLTFHKERNQWGCGGYLCVEYAFLSPNEAKFLYNSYTGCRIT